MNDTVIQWEQEALAYIRNGYEKAAKLYQKIIDKNPRYKCGFCFYDLAGCLERLDKLQEAEKNYIKALEYDPASNYMLSDYAEFLYLYGDPAKAFHVFLNLYKLEKEWGNQQRQDSSISALKDLGKKIGLTDKEVMAKIDEV